MRDPRALGLYVLDSTGEPLLMPDVRVWAEWMETASRSVALTLVGEGRVSTVFLGLDHSFDWFSGHAAVPVLWETMTFDVPGLECDCQRYTSRADAVLGHAAAVARARAALHVAARAERHV